MRVLGSTLLRCHRILGCPHRPPSSERNPPMTELAKPRPEFRNINAFKDLPTYRLPAPGWVSILHRISGVLMFVLLPFIIWMFDTSLSSEISFAKFRSAFNNGLGIFPGFLIKLVALA